MFVICIHTPIRTQPIRGPCMEAAPPADLNANGDLQGCPPLCVCRLAVEPQTEAEIALSTFLTTSLSPQFTNLDLATIVPQALLLAAAVPDRRRAAALLSQIYGPASLMWHVVAFRSGNEDHLRALTAAGVCMHQGCHHMITQDMYHVESVINYVKYNTGWLERNATEVHQLSCRMLDHLLAEGADASGKILHIDTSTGRVQPCLCTFSTPPSTPPAQRTLIRQWVKRRAAWARVQPWARVMWALKTAARARSRRALACVWHTFKAPTTD